MTKSFTVKDCQTMMLTTEMSLQDYLYQIRLSEEVITRIFQKIAVVESTGVAMGRIHEQNKRPAPVAKTEKEEKVMKLRERADKWQREYANLKKRYDRLGLVYDKMKEEVERKNREIEHLKKVLEKIS